MKPKLIDWIPIYGDITYFKRYFKAEKRTEKEAWLAQWFSLYHIFCAFMLILLAICALKKYNII